MKVYAVIVAAGAGSRFGGEIPKQFMLLDGVPVCVRAAAAFAKAFPEGDMVIVLPAADFDRWRAELQPAVNGWPQKVLFVAGGESRWQSVKNALTALNDAGASPSATVLVHDGARPLVDGDTLRRVAQATVNTDAAVPVVEVTDSLRKILDNGVESEPVNRADYRAVQTPQGSKLWRMLRAYDEPFSPEFTDDASVLAAAGFSNIVLVKGNPRNIKITNPFDLRVAQCILHELNE